MSQPAAGKTVAPEAPALPRPDPEVVAEWVEAAFSKLTRDEITC